VSSYVAGVKHDDSKEMQQQVGSHLMEVQKLYSHDAVDLYPEDVKKEAQVQMMSAKGTTNRDKELKDQKIKVAIWKKEKKSKSKAPFPPLEDYKKKAKERKVDNDVGWVYVDEETRQKEGDMEKAKKVLRSGEVLLKSN